MANIQKVEILSPLGKLVQGSVWELQDQYEDDGKTLKKDKQTGEVVKRAYFAIAVPKDSPEWFPFWTKLVEIGKSGYPQYFQNGNMPGLKEFAYKVMDGDGVDKKGNPNNQKPGFAGCWIVKFSSSFLPRCFENGKFQKHQQLQDPRSIRSGFFIRVGVLAAPNIGSQSPGLYLNADLVSLEFVCRPEDEITYGRDAGAAFGNAQTTYVPQGAQQMPAGGMPGMQQGNGNTAMGVMPGVAGHGSVAMPGVGSSPGSAMSAGMQQSNPTGGMPGMQQQGGMPGMMPGQQVQPNAGFVQGAMQQAGVMPGMQQQPGAMPGMMQQPQYQMTPNANGYTREQFHQNGFNDEQLIAQGYMIRVA